MNAFRAKRGPFGTPRIHPHLFQESRKVTVRPALYGAPVRLLVRALRLVGVRPLELVRAPIFRLLALEEHDVIEALGELNRLDAVRFRMQGDVVELDIEEVA